MIPFATTTITISRVVPTSGTEDGYDANPAAPTQIATGVRAVISTPTASARLSGGDRVVYTASMRSDPVSLQSADTVTAADGTVWVCLWAREQTGVGLDFTLAELRMVTGAT